MSEVAIRPVNAASREGLQVGTPGRQPCVFLDRDGVINSTETFVNTPQDLDRQLMPQALRAIARLSRESDLPIVLVTNQSAVGEGRIPVAANDAILHLLEQRVEEAGGRLDAIYFCPNTKEFRAPAGQVNGRKPEPGMMLQAAHDLGSRVDLADSYMVGDMTTDIAAGEAATPDLTTVLVETGFGGRDGKVHAKADHVSPDLEAAVDWILAREGARA